MHRLLQLTGCCSVDIALQAHLRSMPALKSCLVTIKWLRQLEKLQSIRSCLMAVMRLRRQVAMGVLSNRALQVCNYLSSR